jgi:hypothetical protein
MESWKESDESGACSFKVLSKQGENYQRGEDIFI